MSKKTTTIEGPRSLTLSLHEPGMTPMHRAGLGGLACTLSALARAVKAKTWPREQTPGWPWPAEDQPPWEITEQSVVLNFEDPTAAQEYLRRLFAYAFQIKDGLIYLPGQYATEPAFEVRAFLQSGLTLSFLQHGKAKTMAKEATVKQYDVGDSTIPAEIQFRSCSAFRHQSGLDDGFCGKDGCFLSNARIDVAGPLSPGSVVRHVGFNTDTGIDESSTTGLSLYFAIVGTIAMPVRGGIGLLIIPEVRDLKQFTRYRRHFTPMAARDCQTGSAGDAAMQAYARLSAVDAAIATKVPGCRVVTLTSLPWASQQKSRSSILQVVPGGEAWLQTFRVALHCLPPRIVVPKEEPASDTHTGTPRKKAAPKKPKGPSRAWWSDSVVRPLIADNLARQRPWYEGFRHLMTALDSNNKPIRDQLKYETKGLHNMIKEIPWEHEGEASIVRAVHIALRQRYGQIASDSSGPTMKKRFEKEYDKWRLGFAGAKTPDQFRNSICDLFSRAGGNAELKVAWPAVLPLLHDSRWSLTRDLALLALASYQGTPAAPVTDPNAAATATT
jgi:CRISPR-associated protein Cas8a1/Csx13